MIVARVGGPGYECPVVSNAIGRTGRYMQIAEDPVRRIARLARIRISDEEAAAFKAELSSILNWVAQLDEVDTDGIAPMTSVVHMQLPQRADVVDDGGYADDIVANAPVNQDNYFIVPKVVE